MVIFLSLLFIGLGILSFIFKSIYFFIITFSGFSIFLVYTLIKSVKYRKISKTEVSSKIDLYCKESGIIVDYWVYLILWSNVKYDLNFKYILENFSKSIFKEQFFFVYDISIVICILCALIMFIYAIIDSKKGIIYKEGLILGDGKLYRFDRIKSYEFKTSFKGREYRDLVLNFNKKISKTMYIYKDDIDKFKELLEKNC